MKIARHCTEKAGIIKAKEKGLQNAGEASRASYSGNFETLIFYISEIRAGQGCENKRREVKQAWEERGTRSGTRA